MNKYVPFDIKKQTSKALKPAISAIFVNGRIKMSQKWSFKSEPPGHQEGEPGGP